MRTGDRIAVAAVGAVALLGVGTGAWVASGSAVGTAPWAARIYSRQGVVGPEQAPRIQCRNKPVWRAVQVVAPPPVIYARDQRAGGANDAAIVRYRAFVVDFTTGQTVDTSSYSGFAAAWDNAPAQFTGDPATFRLDPDLSLIHI